MKYGVRILVGIPSYDRRVDIEIAKGLVNLERGGYNFDVCFPVSSHISRNRNYIVHQMLREDYKWLFFWDSDIAIEEGFMDKMMETAYKHQAQIVCGCYKMKEESGKYVLGERQKDGTYQNLIEIHKIREVDAGGTGIMLIHRDVLVEMEEPWFTILDGKQLFVMPEDFEFCRRAKELGYKIVADPRFATHHYGTKAYSHG